MLKTILGRCPLTVLKRKRKMMSWIPRSVCVCVCVCVCERMHARKVKTNLILRNWNCQISIVRRGHGTSYSLTWSSYIDAVGSLERFLEQLGATSWVSEGWFGTRNISLWSYLCRTLPLLGAVAWTQEIQFRKQWLQRWSERQTKQSYSEANCGFTVRNNS
jgi:hypothetical protein